MTQLLPRDPHSDTPLNVYLKQACDTSDMTLSNLSDQIQNAYQAWIDFIEQNCQKGECERIRKALEQRRQELCLYGIETLTTSEAPHNNLMEETSI